MLHECPKCRTLNRVSKDGGSRCASCGRVLRLSADDVRAAARRTQARYAVLETKKHDDHPPAA